MTHFFDFGGDLILLSNIQSLCIDKTNKLVVLATDKEDFELEFDDLNLALACHELHKKKLLNMVALCDRLALQNVTATVT